jgi:NDP-sugar pyrophosphorylase family protein
MAIDLIGMILCGGHGKRLRPFTDEIPKSLLEIKEGYTILERQLFGYGSAGFDRVYLLTGYLSEKIEEKIGSNYKGMKIEYVVDDEPLGTLNAIRLGMERAGEDAMISNGDVVTDLNLRMMCKKFQGSNCLASIFAVKMRSPYGLIILKNGLIERFEEKPILEHYINGGFYCLRKETLDLLEEYKVGNIEKTAFPRLAQSRQLTYFIDDNPFWVAIDTLKDLEEAREEYKNRVDKPWGYEKMLTLSDEKMEKELFIMAGHQTSYHYHEIRDETLHIVKGSGYVEFEKNRERFIKGDAIRIKPNTPHTIIAEENTLVMEVSTPHPDDVVRLRDFYRMR